MVVAVVMAAATAAVALFGRGDDARAIVDRGTVTAIVDGDTIDITIGGRSERVRLLAIDTPEIAHRDEPGECFGDVAADHLATLLPVGAIVRLERDIVGRDDYGRLLAYVYRTGDELFVNVAMVAAGLATPLVIAPNVAHRDDVVDAARRAEAGDVGLWAACGG